MNINEKTSERLKELEARHIAKKESLQISSAERRWNRNSPDKNELAFTRQDSKAPLNPEETSLLKAKSVEKEAKTNLQPAFSKPDCRLEDLKYKPDQIYIPLLIKKCADPSPQEALPEKDDEEIEAKPMKNFENSQPKNQETEELSEVQPTDLPSETLPENITEVSLAEDRNLQPIPSAQQNVEKIEENLKNICPDNKDTALQESETGDVTVESVTDLAEHDFHDSDEVPLPDDQQYDPVIESGNNEVTDFQMVEEEKSPINSTMKQMDMSEEPLDDKIMKTPEADAQTAPASPISQKTETLNNKTANIQPPASKILPSKLPQQHSYPSSEVLDENAVNIQDTVEAEIPSKPTGPKDVEISRRPFRKVSNAYADSGLMEKVRSTGETAERAEKKMTHVQVGNSPKSPPKNSSPTSNPPVDKLINKISNNQELIDKKVLSSGVVSKELINNEVTEKNDEKPAQKTPVIKFAEQPKIIEIPRLSAAKNPEPVRRDGIDESPVLSEDDDYSQVRPPFPMCYDPDFSDFDYL